MIGEKVNLCMATRHKSMMYLKIVRAKGREYCYFDTGQKDARGKTIYARLPTRSDRDFAVKYATMLGHRTRRANVQALLTVPKLVEMYQGSSHFAGLAPASRKIYALYLGVFAAMLPTAPAGLVERKDVATLLEKRAKTPAAANMILATISALYKWARKNGHVNNRPADDLDPMDIGEHDPWPEALVQAALEASDVRVRLSVHLLYYTAQRIGDVVRMRWGDIANGEIAVRQQKTGAQLVIPLHPDLEKELAKHARDLAPIIKAQHGKGLATMTLRTNIQQWAAERGHKVVPHGLRKNAVNTLLELGCSVAQTAAISGQSIQMIEHYAKKRSQAILARSAMQIWGKNR